MSRKKLTNNESFIFNESDVVNPIRSRALSDRSTVQRRLFPKAENLESPRNPHVSPRKPPVAPRNPPVAPHNPLVPSSHSGPAGDHNVTKNSTTTDPSLELGLAGDHNVAKNTTTTDPSLEAIMSKLASLDTGSPQATCATDAAQSKSTTMASTPKPATNKRVLLQVVPNSVSQEVLHPFKADFKKIHVLNNNSALNNKPSMKNDLNKSKVTSNNNESGTMAKSELTLTVKPKIGPDRGIFLAGPAAADEEFQNRDLNENEQDNTETCICLRPLKLILCPVCGHTTTGRLRKTCKVHPKDLFLLDVDACPRCKETNKCVFVEYDLPEGFKQFQ